MSDDRLENLAEQYAEGDIEPDEFQEKLDRLEESDDGDETDDGREWTPGQLLDMDEQTARSELSPEQFERWHKLHDLNDDAEQTKFEWQQESKRVQELTVNADMQQLGTEVDLFGNDVLVHIDSGNREFRRAADRLEDAETDLDDRAEVDALPEEQQEEIARALQDMLDAVLVEWNGQRWSDLSDAERGAVLDQCREKWGVNGLMLAWVRIAKAANEDREETEELIESFRST